MGVVGLGRRGYALLETVLVTRGKWVTRKPHPVTELPGFKK